MFVQKLFEKKSGKTLLYFATGKRINGVTKKTLVEKIGYLEDLQSHYPDPIAHFKEIAKQKTEEAKSQEFDLRYSTSDLFNFSSDFNKQKCSVPESVDNVRSYGVLPLMKIYRDLELDYFLNIKRQYKKVDYNLNHISLFTDSKPLR